MKITRAELKQSTDITIDEYGLDPDIVREISEWFAQLDLEQLGYND